MLTRTFLKTLCAKAHSLRPVVLIGNNGLTPTVHQEIEAALVAHELVKIRVNAANREDRQSMMSAITKLHQASVVQNIGHVLVIYRKCPH